MNMKLTYSQRLSYPWGYSFHGSQRVYKARLLPYVAEQLVKEIGNANLTNTWLAKSGKVIVVIIDFSTSKVWETIRTFKPKQPAKQLLLRL